MKVKIFLVLTLVLFLIGFSISQSVEIGSESTITGVNIVLPQLPTFNNQTAFVNASNFWFTNSYGPLDDVNTSHFIPFGSILTINETFFETNWSNVSLNYIPYNDALFDANLNAKDLTNIDVLGAEDLNVNDLTITQRFIVRDSTAPTMETDNNDPVINNEIIAIIEFSGDDDNGKSRTGAFIKIRADGVWSENKVGDPTGGADMEFFLESNTAGTQIGTAVMVLEFNRLLMKDLDTRHNDNAEVIFGTGADTTLTYDGSNFIINPKSVGTGQVIIEGNLTAENITADFYFGDGSQLTGLPNNTHLSNFTDDINATANQETNTDSNVTFAFMNLTLATINGIDVGFVTEILPLAGGIVNVPAFKGTTELFSTALSQMAFVTGAFLVASENDAVAFQLATDSGNGDSLVISFNETKDNATWDMSAGVVGNNIFEDNVWFEELTSFDGEVHIHDTTNIHNNSITEIFSLDFSNGDQIFGNNSIDIFIQGNIRAIFGPNDTQFTGDVQNIDDVNSFSRFAETNLNSGAGAASVFTARNDVGQSVFLGVTSSGFNNGNPLLGANIGFLFFNTTFDSVFANALDTGFVWLNNPLSTRQFSDTDDNLMSLSKDGFLTVSANITTNNLTINDYISFGDKDEPVAIPNFVQMYSRDNKMYIMRDTGIERRLLDGGGGSFVIDEEVHFNNYTSFNFNVTLNATLITQDGGKLWSNATCTFLSSPSGNNVLEVCD